MSGRTIYAYVNQSPVGRIDALGLWSKNAHDYFIEQFVEAHMPELRGQWGLIDRIKQGSAKADSKEFQKAEFSYMHAMSSSAFNEVEAKKMMCLYVKAYRNVYRNMPKKGADGADAYFFLGMALHAVMDSTSPEHRNFQYWPDLTDPAILKVAPRHGGFDRLPTSNESLKEAVPYRNETVNLMKQILDGNDAACGCEKK